MNKFVTGLMIAATLAGGVVATVDTASAQDWRRHHYHGGGGGGDAAAAAALGLVGGMIIGGALASQSQPDYVYQNDYVVRRAPRRVYTDEGYGYRGGSYCRTLIKYDMYGRPYEYKDCDP